MEITEAMIRDALAEAQRAENDSLLGQIASLTLGYEFHADVGKLASLNAKEERRSIELDHLVNAALIVALIRPAIEAEAIKQGRKDVVDWMFTHMVKDNPEHEPFRGLIAIKKETWQFQLKEWGIKPEAKE